MTDPEMKALDKVLAEAAEARPEVPDALMAAVLRDARDVQRDVRLSQDQGLWATLLDVIGGWPAVSGLAAAGITGLWVGVAPPVGLEMVAGDFWGETQQVDLFGGDTLSVFAVAEEG